MGVAGSIVPYGQTYRDMTDEEVTHAALLWRAGKDSQQIARLLLLHESRVMQRFGAIKEIARTFE